MCKFVGFLRVLDLPENNAILFRVKKANDRQGKNAFPTLSIDLKMMRSLSSPQTEREVQHSSPWRLRKEKLEEEAWPSSQRVRLAIRRSQVRVPLWPLAGFVVGRRQFRSSATLINSQLVASCQLGFLILLCCIRIICFQVFEWSACKTGWIS